MLIQMNVIRNLEVLILHTFMCIHHTTAMLLLAERLTGGTRTCKVMEMGGNRRVLGAANLRSLDYLSIEYIALLLLINHRNRAALCVYIILTYN